MSEHNPFDDEELFEQNTENTLPLEEEVFKPGIEIDTVLNEISKQVRHHFDQPQLDQISITFEYTDDNGFSSWVTTHYTRNRS